MKIEIIIPIKSQILNGGVEISVARDEESWSKNQLGDYHDKKGVYIFHSNQKILYIGKTTDGDYGNFGERLRRHCQKKASANSTVYQLLLSQKTPMRAFLLDTDDLDMMIDNGSISLTQERKALIMEQVLIGIYLPDGNKR